MAITAEKINKLAEMINHQITRRKIGMESDVLGKRISEHKDELTTEMEMDKEVNNGEKR